MGSLSVYITAVTGRPAGKPTLFPDNPVDNRFDGSFVVWMNRWVNCDVPGAVDLGNSQIAIGFSPVCTHMGCLLVRGMKAGEHDLQPFEPESKQLICGPCRCHGTSFDLVKAGLVVLGPATQNLPQLALRRVNENGHAQSDGTHIQAHAWLNDPDPRFEHWPYKPRVVLD